MEIDRDIKKEIELYLYYLGNGTLGMKYSELQNVDYREIISNRPKLFIEASKLYINGLKKNEEGLNNKSQVLNLIYNSLNQEKGRQEDYKMVLRKDLLFVKRFIEIIGNPNSKTELRRFKELIKLGNDLQLAFCIWSNNIKLNEEGEIINEDYAAKRLDDYIKLAIDEITPEKDFSDIEIRHDT